MYADADQVREMGVLVTAIIVAGRTGSAFTAEIGLMKAGEQLSAMEMMAVDPLARIVAPVLIRWGTDEQKAEFLPPITSTRFGCGAESCGACFVVIEGKAVASCTLPLSGSIETSQRSLLFAARTCASASAPARPASRPSGPLGSAPPRCCLHQAAFRPGAHWQPLPPPPKGSSRNC